MQTVIFFVFMCIRDFVFVYRQCILLCAEPFIIFWGQTLFTVLHKLVLRIILFCYHGLLVGWRVSTAHWGAVWVETNVIYSSGECRTTLLMWPGRFGNMYESVALVEDQVVHDLGHDRQFVFHPPGFKIFTPEFGKALRSHCLCCVRG